MPVFGICEQGIKDFSSVAIIDSVLQIVKTHQMVAILFVDGDDKCGEFAGATEVDMVLCTD